MPREIVEKAFEPFFTTKPVGQGSGLGLSMVYGFIKQSQGHLKIYSEVGHGTTVKIYLPKAEREDARADTNAASVPLPTGTESILLVEDRSEEHTSELQSLMRISYAVFCLKKKNRKQQ